MKFLCPKDPEFYTPLALNCQKGHTSQHLRCINISLPRFFGSFCKRKPSMPITFLVLEGGILGFGGEVLIFREMPPVLLQHVLTVLVFWSWVLRLPRLPPRSRSLRLFPWASILLHRALGHCLCKNGTHSTCFYSTGGHTPKFYLYGRGDVSDGQRS